MSGYAVLAIIGLLYASSWWLHPLKACRACKGTSRHFGSVHKSKFRFCHACAGRGRVPRPGAVVLVKLGMMKDPERTGSLGWIRKNRGR